MRNHPPIARTIAHRGRQAVSGARCALVGCGDLLRAHSLALLAMRPCRSSPRLLSLRCSVLSRLAGVAAWRLCAGVRLACGTGAGHGCSSGLPAALQTCRAAEAGSRAASRRGQLAVCASCAIAPHAVALPPRIPAPLLCGRRVARGRAAYAGARWPPRPPRCSPVLAAARAAPCALLGGLRGCGCAVGLVRPAARRLAPFPPGGAHGAPAPLFPVGRCAPLVRYFIRGDKGFALCPCALGAGRCGLCPRLASPLALVCASGLRPARPVGPCRAVCAPASPRAPVGWWRAAPLSLSASRWR